jgi:hypothetical protein
MPRGGRTTAVVSSVPGDLDGPGLQPKDQGPHPSLRSKIVASTVTGAGNASVAVAKPSDGFGIVGPSAALRQWRLNVFTLR